MDPYLEGDLWTSVHTDLCAEIARQLSPKLRPKYVALSTRRVILAPPDENEGLAPQRFLDVGILSSHPPPSAVGTTVASAPLILPASFPEPIPHVSVEIRDVAQRRLVTCIEVLSPTNKRGPGREEYAAKGFQLASGNAHFVEIDLLRAGTRFPAGEPLPPAPYFVFISRGGHRNAVEVWPITLQHHLPVIKIPLMSGDEDVPLDLQQALSVVYEIIGYDELIDYAQPPTGPLTAEEAAWVEEQLSRAGRRNP
jgi:hypothetical protein